MIAKKTLLLTCSALAALTLLGNADQIHRTDGSVLEGVTVSGESWTEVNYKQGGDKTTMPADEVLRVEFDAMPLEVDEALGFLAEGDFLGAMQYLDGYVDAQIKRSNERRYPWAPAYAAWRVSQVRLQVADLPGAVAAAKRLIKNFPNSRYLPEAYLLMANAEQRMGKTSDAIDSLDEFSGVVSSNGLSDRWALAVQLAKVGADSTKKGPTLRADLARVGREAGDTYPTVRNRALLAEGESYLVEAETASASTASELRDKARKGFDALVGDATSTSEVLAGSYTGLGDCLFFRGAAADDKDVLKEAAKMYLRVVLNHGEQSHYVPKALYYAFRCFEIIGDKSKRSDMRRELLKLYPDSVWAKKNDLR